MTGELLAFLMPPPRHPRPANSMRGASSAVYHNYRLHYSDEDNPSICLACQLVKQNFLGFALIVINLLVKINFDTTMCT